MCIAQNLMETFLLFSYVHQEGESTDYGRPMKLFSSKYQTFWLGQTIWAGKSGAFGVLWVNLSAIILVVSVPCPCFPQQPLFLKKTKPLYQNPKYLFEFGLQRIRDLAIVCPQSVGCNTFYWNQIGNFTTQNSQTYLLLSHFTHSALHYPRIINHTYYSNLLRLYSHTHKKKSVKQSCGSKVLVPIFLRPPA